MFKLIANIKNIIMPIKYNDFLFGFFLYIYAFTWCVWVQNVFRECYCETNCM